MTIYVAVNTTSRFWPYELCKERICQYCVYSLFLHVARSVNEGWKSNQDLKTQLFAQMINNNPEKWIGGSPEIQRFPATDAYTDQNAMPPQYMFCFKIWGTTITFSRLGKLTLLLVLCHSCDCCFSVCPHKFNLLRHILSLLKSFLEMLEKTTGKGDCKWCSVEEEYLKSSMQHITLSKWLIT